MDQTQPKKLVRRCDLLLRLASLIVPISLRPAWLKKWRAEVWHWAHFLIESRRLNRSTERDLARHCWSAFPDALWQRFNRNRAARIFRSYPLSAGFCLCGIAVCFLFLLAIGPRTYWSRSTNNNANSLLVVRLGDKSRWLEPDLMQDAAAQWAHNALVSGAATYAYRPSVMRGLTGKEDLITARVTPEMFQLLGAGAVLGRLFNPADPDQVVLSNAMWRRRFLADPGIVGRHFYLNHRRVEVVGVLPEDFQLPGVDVDMFMSFAAGEGPSLRGLEWPGVVLRLANGISPDYAKAELRKYVNQTRFPTPAFFDVLSAKDLRYRAISSWGAVTFFAVLMILAFNGRAVVGLCSKNPRRTVPEACRWWLFFVVKSGLLIAVVLLASMDLVHIAVQRFGLNAYDYASGAVTWIFVVGLTIAVTWAIRDQGARCRTCLKLLRTETFLGARFGPLHAPSGFELVCDKGHGALHIPVTWISCLDSERWTEFDESWRELAQNA